MSPKSSSPAPAPAPAPAPVPEKVTLKTALSDVEVGLGAIVTGAEAILVAVPSGPVTSGLQIAVPVLVAVLAALRKIKA